MRNKKLIFLFHGTKSSLIKKISDIDSRKFMIILLERLAILLSSSIVVPSLFARDYVNSLINPLGKLKRFYIVPNYVDDEFFRIYSKKSLIAVKKKLNISLEDKIILYSGRIVENKGLEELIVAFNTFLSAKENLRIVIAYPESSSNLNLLNQLKIKIRDLGISNSVIFITNLRIPDLIKIYKISNLIVLFSKLEMAPLVLIEALASGTPCIATKVGNAEEILSKVDKKLILTGKLVPNIVNKFEYFFSLPKININLLKKRSRIVAKRYSGLKSAILFTQILDSSLI